MNNIDKSIELHNKAILIKNDDDEYYFNLSEAL